MYKGSLYLNIKATPDKERILKMFFSDWADNICRKEIKFSTIQSTLGPQTRVEIVRVDFENEEDAIAIKLKGIPPELQNYLSFARISQLTA